MFTTLMSLFAFSVTMSTHESYDTSISRSEILNTLNDAIIEDPTGPIERLLNLSKESMAE